MSGDPEPSNRAAADHNPLLPHTQETVPIPDQTVNPKIPVESYNNDHLDFEHQELSQFDGPPLENPSFFPGLGDVAAFPENSELPAHLDSPVPQTPQSNPSYSLTNPSTAEHVTPTDSELLIAAKPTASGTLGSAFQKREHAPVVDAPLIDAQVVEAPVVEAPIVETSTDDALVAEDAIPVNMEQIQTDGPLTQSVGETEWLSSAPVATDFLARNDIVSRTNSFPTFQSSDEPTKSVECSIYTQNVQNPDNAIQSEQNIGNNFTTTNSKTQPTSSAWKDEDQAEAEGDDFFSQVSSQTKPIYIPPEFAESRFEEGLPLVDNTSHNEDYASAPQLKEENRLSSVFREDESTEEAGFFSSIPAANEQQYPSAPPSLHRKQTSQVLDSLKLDSALDESPIESSHAQGHQFPYLEDKLTKDESTAPEKMDENDLAERWKAELDGDLLEDELLDDDLLDDNVDVPEPVHVEEQPMAAQRYAPSSSTNIPRAPPPPSPINPYAPHQPSSSSMVAGIAPAIYGDHFQPTSPVVGHTESFSNQSKAGYKSPYDLPDDLQPKRRVAPRTVSNMSQPFQAIPDSRPSSSYGTGQTPTAPPVPVNPAYAPPPQPLVQRPAAPSNFFEELPTTSRSRPSTGGRYAPQPTDASRQAPLDTPTTMIPLPPTQQQVEPQLQSQYQLQPPARMDPYANVPAPAHPGVPKQTQHSPRTNGRPASSARYSPAPPLSSSAPAHSYMPNHAGSYSSGITLPFQPRTSSPLAQHDSSNMRVQIQPETPRVNGFVNHEPAQHLSPPSSHDFGPKLYPPTAAIQSNMPPPPGPIQASPPRRSQTQSPGKRINSLGQMTIPQNSLQRPASAHAQSAPEPSAYAPPTRAMTNESHLTPAHDFIPPTDNHALDELERWKGAPIIKFGFGGTLIISFPKRVPLYSTGQLAPRMKPVPGEVNLRSVSEAFSRSAVAKFPGPLRSKSKKKEVISWLSNMISNLEHENTQGFTQLTLEENQSKQEKILLWKVLRTLVEYDGVLRGAPEVEKSLIAILAPTAQREIQDGPAISSADGLYGKAEPANANLSTIHQNLLLGEREKAVWDAVDHRLWGHAMLLSSTLNQSVWKQVVQEFIRREVRSVGENTQSLAALYEVFAGNFEESADELVPPSARAGLQMVNMRTGQGPAGNALDGLNKWQETLSLIISNRSAQDEQAIMALGKLLSSYGRVEAAHICFLVARSNANSIFGSVDDPNAYITLIGADHKRYPFTFMTDPTCCLLTEVYEFATSVLTATPAHVLPHLQAFKLRHAFNLAETGHKSEAQQYCDALGALLKAATKISPLYNQRFFIELDELSNRLRQSPGDAASSWMSKPSMEKVSGSMWAKFNSFVAGDDTDPTSSDSPKTQDDQGPFANIVGTPPITHSPGGPELYGSYSPSHQQQPVSIPTSNSRYAPNNQQYSTFSSPDQLRGRRSLDSQRSPSRGPSARSYSQRRHSQDPSVTAEGTHNSMGGIHSYTPVGMASHATNHSAPLPIQSSLAPVEEASSSLAPSITSEPAPTVGLSGPNINSFQSDYLADDATYSPPSQVSQDRYQPPSYEPPSYEPPSYEPHIDDSESPESESAEEQKPKRKGFMDDDVDSNFSRDVAPKMEESDRSRRDREAAELVRKAAEEDAKKAAAQAEAKKGWFTGWFGKRDASSSGGPIRAKLGEQSSFYFDEDLQRWVNKKDPDSATAAAPALPPPPRGSAPGSRSASSEQRPPTSASMASAPDALPIPKRGLSAQGPNSPFGSAPPMSVGAPLSSSPGGRSFSGGNTPAGPPSRPGTALSHASSIDDLLAAPQTKKGTLKGRKKGRYVDVMATS